MHFELQNWLSWVGDIELQYQKTINNQPYGSNSLGKCMSWDGCTRLGPEEPVRPIVLDYCNKKGGTAVAAGWALDGPTSPKGTRQHQSESTQQSTGLLERVAPGDDG